MTGEDMKPQTQQLLSYMHHFGSVTQLEALRDLGCFRLASRVHELREHGYRINTRRVKTPAGKTYACYQLVA